MKMKWIAMVVAAGILASGAARATLMDRGGGLIYDSDQNITWLQDANYAKTSGVDADGRMTWSEAMAWVAGLSYGGHDDWRLPGITDTGTSGCDWSYGGTDCGYNSGGEQSYMFHNNLGLKGYFSSAGTYQSNWGIYGVGSGGVRSK